MLDFAQFQLKVACSVNIALFLYEGLTLFLQNKWHIWRVLEKLGKIKFLFFLSLLDLYSLVNKIGKILSNNYIILKKILVSYL